LLDDPIRGFVKAILIQDFAPRVSEWDFAGGGERKKEALKSG
jgi:hypothetical protein